MNEAPILNCSNVTKRYGKQTALDRLALRVEPGEVFGLLGPNGAGKTTFIKIILGLAAPNAGQIELFGQDLFRRRNALIRDVGAVVEAPMFFEYMSAWDNLRYLVRLSGKVDDQRLEQILHTVGLESARNKKVGDFSYGMKQRLGIAQALLPETRFLILDEPTNGLDPHGIAGIRELIRRLSNELSITIFLSSHLLVEVERVCDRVAIIHHGEKVLEGVVGELKGKSIRTAVHLRPDSPIPELGRIQPETTETAGTGEIVLEFCIAPEDVPELVAELVAGGARIIQVLETERSLEDIFLEHTKGGALDVRIDSFRD